MGQRFARRLLEFKLQTGHHINNKGNPNQAQYLLGRSNFDVTRF
jgi:hypothetical protein